MKSNYALIPVLLLLTPLLATYSWAATQEESFTVQPALDLRDFDNDGVVNARDICGNSPTNSTIDGKGCAQWHLVQSKQDFVVEFGFDKDKILPEHAPLFNEVVELISNHPDARILLVGDTSPEGTDEYNKQLGERRAWAVTDALTERGITNNKILGFVYSDELLKPLMKKRLRRTIIRVQFYNSDPIPSWNIYTAERARNNAN